MNNAPKWFVKTLSLSSICGLSVSSLLSGSLRVPSKFIPCSWKIKRDAWITVFYWHNSITVIEWMAGKCGTTLNLWQRLLKNGLRKVYGKDFLKNYFFCARFYLVNSLTLSLPWLKSIIKTTAESEAVDHSCFTNYMLKFHNIP